MESSRTVPKQVRFFGHPKREGVCIAREEAWFIRHNATWTVHLCRMGPRRAACVSVEGVGGWCKVWVPHIIMMRVQLPLNY